MESGENILKNNEEYNDKNPFGFKCHGIDEDNKKEELLLFNEMLSFLGVSNTWGYILTCSNSWYYSVPGSSILQWASDGTDKDILDKLQEVSFTNPALNSHYTKMTLKSSLDGKLKEGGLYISLGETVCDESCIFSKVCDGEVGSPFNPSTQSLPCNKFKLNKHEIIKIG